MSRPRYPSVTWPWVGLLLCLALLGQEYLELATGPNAPLTAYHVTLMAVGVTSLVSFLLGDALNQLNLFMILMLPVGNVR